MAEILSVIHVLPPGTFVPLPDAPRSPLPLDGVKVSAGFPSPAADYEDRRLDINDYLVRNPVSTFFFSVEGDSMEGAEIFAGDILVVDKSIRPRHGHIVIAFVDGERLVKRLYAMRSCAYLLDRLENDSKEKIDTSSFTIEHVLPQNENLASAWREMLGDDWKVIQETWLHRLGNLTLTGYNSEYSDRSFDEKKEMAKGFNDSPLRLNRFIREQPLWTAAEIETRGKALAKQAVGVWPGLVVDMDAVRQADLEEGRAAAAQYSVETVCFDPESRALFDAIRPHLLALGEDVIELCGARSVVYRVFDHFLEILPRTKYILLLANIDFDETDDPSGLARDASDWAFITNASESGDVLFSLKDGSQIPAAMHIVLQAYERVTE